MKKIVLCLLFIMTGCVVYAQKSYINMIAYYSGSSSNAYPNYINLSGDVPSEFKSTYSISEISIGDLLNQLSAYGYNVEFMCGEGIGLASSSNNSKLGIVYLLSKNSSNPSHVFERIAPEDNSDVHEVARYNLQGLPIDESEKGVQIIVYSNYTTKTIIKE